MQEILILVLFVAAVVYTGRLIYKAFSSTSCATGCGKCNAVDFNKIEKQLKEKGI